MFRNLIRNMDMRLMVAVLLLFAIGLVAITSATNALEVGFNRQIPMQIAGFAIGFVIMLFMMAIDYNTFGDFYRLIYVLSIILLLMVYLPGIGVAHAGAKSWIKLGPVDFQTSELAKIGYVLFMAKYLEQQQNQLENIRDLIMPALLSAPFMLLLLKQPDLGSALVFVAITAGMVYVGNLRTRVFFGTVCAAVMASPLAYFFMKPHQRERIDAFLNQSDQTLKGNYHVLQSKITIGSGELLGRGIFQGVYHRYDFLPVQESDFIFAVLVEETGFVGGVVLILICFWALSRMIAVSRISKDLYGTLVVTGIACMYAFQIFENIGMTIGLMPVTGVTLPFVSYGGTSVMVNMIALGLVHNVYMRRRRSGFSI